MLAVISCGQSYRLVTMPGHRELSSSNMARLKIPSEGEMVAIMQARREHDKVCNKPTCYDLSGYRIKLTCQCGWTFELPDKIEEK